jgi:hypothetical protein
MKMKAPVEMMNVVARKTRLAREVVLLGVGLFVGILSLGLCVNLSAEERESYRYI